MFDLICHTSLRWGEEGLCHWEDLCLVSWLKCWTQVMSPVMTLKRKLWPFLSSFFHLHELSRDELHAHWSSSTFESSKQLIPISLSQKAILCTPCIFDAVSKFEAKEGKVVPVHGMKACRRRRRVVAPLILNCGTKWCQVVNFMPQLLHPRKRTPVSIEYEAGWIREPVWMFWRREKFCYIISGFEAWIGQPVAQSVYHVCYHGSFWSKIWHKCVVPSDWPFRKSNITLTVHNSKYWERSAEGFVHKMQCMDSEDSYTMTFSGRKLFRPPLLFMVVRLGTLGYAFTHQFCKKMSTVWWFPVWCFRIYDISWLLLWNFLQDHM